MNQENNQIDVKPIDKSKVTTFIRVVIYLAVITTVELIIAFTFPHEYKWIRNTIFILLTIVKAYYIVSVFMHLGHERISLKLSIVLPMVLVIFFIYVMIYQGDAIFKLLF